MFLPMKLFTTVTVFLAIALGAGLRPVAQTTACDPLLEQPKTNPYGYRLRSDRCEGIYVQQVAGATLLLASFTEMFEEYDPRSARELKIRWTTPATGDVHLRAYGLRRKLYYRMDAKRPASPRSFDWPADLLGALNIPKRELGVVGWIRQPVGRIERDVHLPLRITVNQEGSSPGPYALVLLPGVPLSEVYVSVAPVDSDGQPAKWTRYEQPLENNYYPPESPIDIRIERPAASGVYYVLIGADIAGGGSLTSELWFYHPPQ
jgi:hypothetical protein